MVNRAAVAASVALPGGLGLAACSSTSTLDPAKAQTAIQNKIAESDQSASNVSCPSSVPVTVGGTFECTATVNGTPVKVVVTQKDEQGNVDIEVDRKVFYVVGDGVTVIEQGIRDQGASQVTVSCPKAVVVPDGNGTLTCTATADGQSLKVTVPITNGSGGQPSVEPG